jgi:hypothetical protein
MGKYFSLTFYEKNLQEGELWFRDTNNNVLSVSEALKDVFIKYKDVDSKDVDSLTFYEQVNTNTQILRFDIIQDVFFIETSRGNIFDQIVMENGEIKPKTLDNNFTTSLSSRRANFPDYWFDENNRKIYIASNKVESYNGTLNGVNVSYMIEQFDMNTSILDVKYFFNITFNFGINSFYNQIPIVEPVQLTYNKITKTFNISHICRGPKKQFGLVSINILKDQTLDVSSINCFFPFQDTSNVVYKKTIQKKLSIDSDYS